MDYQPDPSLMPAEDAPQPVENQYAAPAMELEPVYPSQPQPSEQPIPQYSPEPTPPVVTEPVPQVQEYTPEATTYAPQPEMTVEMPVSPEEPTVMPMSQNMDTQFQNMPTVQPYAAAPIATQNPFLAFWGRYKKLIVIIGGSLLALAILGAGGYYGYRFYTFSSNANILVKAGENLSSSKEMSTKATIGVDAFSITAKLDVDKDQDLRLTVDNSMMPITAYYLQKKDTLYIKDFTSSFFGSSTTDTSKDYLAYTNVKKALDVVSKTYVNLKDVNPKNNYFTPANMQFIKRESDESVGGRGLYKFTFTPTKAFLDKVIADLKSDKTTQLGYDVSNTSLNASIWIDKSSMQVQKVEGDVSVSIKYTGSAIDSSYSMPDQNFKLHWSEEFTYNMKEDIKLPSGAKMVTTTDLSTLVNDANSATGSANTKATDAKMKAVAHETQNALEQYFLDNSSTYPVAVGASNLKTVLVSSNLLSGSTDLTGMTYIHTASPEGYELSFVLANQDDSGDNVSGISPNKIYTVSSQQ